MPAQLKQLNQFNALYSTAQLHFPQGGSTTLSISIQAPPLIIFQRSISSIRAVIGMVTKALRALTP
jgi:hypothetical protein